MSNLGPQRINQSFGDLLQLPNGLTGSLQAVQDGSGNVTPLQISNTDVQTTFIQSGVGAVMQTMQNKARETVSVLDFGADPTGITDSQPHIQAALDAVQNVGGGTVLLPVGEYKITSTLNLPERVDLVGQGQFSIIRAYSCNAINVQASNVIGPRRVANFWIYANNGNNYSGIVVDLASPTYRAQGLVFEDLYIAFFGTGVLSRGLWHSVFRSCTFNHVWTGLNFYDQNVKILIDDCRITYGGLVSGSGDSVGIQIGDAVSTARPEDVIITASIIFGFNVGCVWRTCLFGGITNCDFDGLTKEGIIVTTADGGFVIRDCWIQVDNASFATKGIDFVNLGYVRTPYNIAISNNKIQTTTSLTGNIGAYIGVNQNDIVFENNAIIGFETSLRTDASSDLRLINNTTSGSSASFAILNTTNTLSIGNTLDTAATYTNNTALQSFNVDPTTSGGGDLQITRGVTFPSTPVNCSNVNTLDDYEEGTFTPTLTRSSSSPTITYSQQNGYYTKIGNVVHCDIAIAWTSNSGGSGYWYLASLPFTNKNTINHYSSAAIGSFDGFTLAAGTTQLGVSIFPNDTQGAFNCSGSAVSSNVITTLANSGSVYLSLTYIAEG